MGLAPLQAHGSIKQSSQENPQGFPIESQSFKIKPKTENQHQKDSKQNVIHNHFWSNKELSLALQLLQNLFKRLKRSSYFESLETVFVSQKLEESRRFFTEPKMFLNHILNHFWFCINFLFLKQCLVLWGTFEGSPERTK